jgi:hypothetical protein
MTDRDLITGLDACRPASDDLRRPELRAVAEQVASDERAGTIHIRIERIDRVVLGAMHDVPLPEGFASRQLARLHDAAREAAIGDAVGSDLSPTTVVPSSSSAEPSRRRRKRIAWSAGLAAAAAAVVAAVILFRPDQPLARDDLESSRQWHDQLVADDQWLPIEPDELQRHALPAELRQLPRRYRDVSSVVGREALAYDLTLPGGPQATLFVIPQNARASGVRGSPPRVPNTSTQGLSVAYWQTGGFIYVVVLQSDRSHDYQQLLRTTSGIAAWLSPTNRRAIS